MTTRGPDDLDDARLERLLAAASAPPTEEELAGERSVMVAFARANEARGRRTLPARLGKLLASKVAAIVLVTSAAGGAAFAAGGAIPNPFGGPGATPADPTTSRPEQPARGGDGVRTEHDGPATRRAEVEATTRPPADDSDAPSRQPAPRPSSDPTPGPAPTGEPVPTEDPVPTPPQTPIPTPTSPTEPPLDPTELPVPTPDLPTTPQPQPQPQPQPDDLPDGIGQSPADRLAE